MCVGNIFSDYNDTERGYIRIQVYVCNNNKEMDMVFNKNIEISSIEEFENCCLEKVSTSPTFMLLKSELIKKILVLI